MSIEYHRESDTTYPRLQVPGVVEPGIVTVITYEEFVTNLVKELGSLEQNLNHMVIGVCGEAGELADAIKKFTIYGKELDLENVIEELGDLEFYMAGLRQMLSIKRDKVIDANYGKLLSRYTGGTYTDAEAIARADKRPGLQVINMGAEQVAAVDDVAEHAKEVNDGQQ